MKFKNPMLVVTDIEAAKAFYKDVLGLRTIADLGANATLSGGVALQTLDSWCSFTGLQPEDIHFAHNTMELDFEEDNFDAFAKKLRAMSGIRYLHDVTTAPWGQRAVRFYDLDGHIIEVGEDMKAVCQRFAASGLSVEEIANEMQVPVGYVQRQLK